MGKPPAPDPAQRARLRLLRCECGRWHDATAIPLDVPAADAVRSVHDALMARPPEPVPTKRQLHNRLTSLSKIDRRFLRLRSAPGRQRTAGELATLWQHVLRIRRTLNDLVALAALVTGRLAALMRSLVEAAELQTRSERWHADRVLAIGLAPTDVVLTAAPPHAPTPAAFAAEAGAAA